MTPLVKPPPELRGGNLAAYQDRSPECLNHGPAGSGKSLAALFKLVHLALIFPKTRWFLVRKTKVSLVESALVTLERDVFGEDSPLLLSRPMMRKTRDYYTLPNGSVIVTAGMDKPEKLFSTEYNGGYVQEATELEQDEWQSLKRSLRAPFTTAVKLKDGPTPVPFYQLWADCNPSYSHHWLKKRMDTVVIVDGKERRLTSSHASVHEDNPRFYDAINHRWRPDGKEYLENQLGGLVGFMRDRLLRGIWSLAEGLVYDEWNEAVHVLTPERCMEVFGGPYPPLSWERYWSMDFGYTDPLSLGFYAKDGDGRLYLYREFYKTGQLVEDVAKWAWEEIKMGREPRPRAIVCDHDPENQMTFSRHCGGMAVTLADKADRKGGIQGVKSRLKVQKDGRPRFYVVKGCLTHPPDKTLQQKGKPTKFTDEVSAYVWDAEKDLPVDGGDHSADNLRYLVTHLDKGVGGWGIR